VTERIEGLEAPLLVCEPVLAEAVYLLRRYSRAQDALFDLLDNGALKVALRVEKHFAALRELFQRYRGTPMSLADTCIVRMAEIHERHAVLTLDSNLEAYRKHGRGPLALIIPQVAEHAVRGLTCRSGLDNTATRRHVRGWL